MFGRLLSALKDRRAKIDDHRYLYRVDRDGYRYCEGPRCLLVQVELLRGRPNRLIYASSIDRWLPPHEGEPISPDRRQEIAETIRAFLDRSGDHAAIQW
jgi:hypothetical protein